MPHDETKSTFLNTRDWGSHLAALQGAATYPKVIGAVKTGRAWFATQASNWLVVNAHLSDKFSVG